jgi:putative ABC transport system ATP-binding protein
VSCTTSTGCGRASSCDWANLGKSTLLNLIAGLDRPDGGRLALDGDDYAQLDEDALTRLRRDKLGFVFQAFHVLPHLTVRQNVALRWGSGDGLVRRRRESATNADAVGLGRAGRCRELPAALKAWRLRGVVHRPKLVSPTNRLGIYPEVSQGGAAQSERQRRAHLVTHWCSAQTADRVLMLGRTVCVTPCS